MTGYTRQSEAEIVNGETINASDFNNEFDQLEAAFDGSTGHTHTGGSGEGAKVSLTASVSGILPFANGGTGGTTYSAGSVLFSNGTSIVQDNANLFWDDTNNFLGLGTITPQNKVHLHASTAIGVALRLTNSVTGSTNADGVVVQVDGSGDGYVWNYENHNLLLGTNNLQRVLINAGGNVSIGNSNNTYKLDITGDANISGAYRIAGTALAASHLSNTTTGTGPVMLAASPTTTGTLTAAAISAASLALGTDLPVTEGGTGASTAATAFANIAVTASSIATPGYIKFANGLVLQWGSVAIVAATSSAITFPIAFPTSLFTIQATAQQTAGATMSAGTATETVNGFTVTLSGVFTGTAWWFAVGV